MKINGAISGALLTGVAALALYASTLAPSVGFVDSGELTTAAAGLGVPHPPGFPLYVLLTHLITRVPIGTAAARANFASALFAALAAATLFLLVHTIAGRAEQPARAAPRSPPPARQRKQQPRPPPADHARLGAWARFAGALIAALLFASLRTTWAYATVAEVYTLAAWLVVLVWLLMARCRMQAAALVFGIAMGVHPAMNVAMLPALAVLVYRIWGPAFLASRQFAAVALVAISGLAVYLYLPLAAMQSPALNWGDPQTPDRLWAHVSGWQYRGTIDITSVAVAESFARLGRILGQQLGSWAAPMALVLAVIGAENAFRNDRTVFWVLVTSIVVNVLLTIWMNAGWSAGTPQEISAADDLDAYYLPALIACAILTGLGAVRLARSAALASAPSLVRPIAVVGVLAGTIGLSVAANWEVNNRRGDVVARAYVDDVLGSIAPGALLLTRDWQISSPMMYVQHVEQQRVDVAAVNLNLLERSWYVADIARRYPAVYAGAQSELSAFREQLIAFEANPRAFNRDEARRRALAAAFDDLVLASAAAYLQTGRVYLTREVALGLDGKGAELARTLHSRYQLVPQGLVFELRRERAFVEPEPLRFDVAPIQEVRRRVGADHIVAQRVAPAYSDMLANRGLYLEKQSRCGEATLMFTDALAIEPTNVAARAALRRCQSRTTPPPLR
jgi:hypothetical protein